VTEPKSEERRRSGWLWVWLVLFVALILLILLWAWPARQPPAGAQDDVSVVRTDARAAIDARAAGPAALPTMSATTISSRT
jgi:di/tricarboxylate transporter